uniref:Uncharacterized protein n=1 Tax=Arundo donax TaxID=35708 RepID=A0A0A9GYD2_ARUDO
MGHAVAALCYRVLYLFLNFFCCPCHISIASACEMSM